MSRTSRPRTVAATGLTLGLAAAGVFLAPVASAAPAAPTLASSTVAPGADFTVTGTGCVEPADSEYEAAAVITPDSDEAGWGDGDDAKDDGTWSLTHAAPTELGVYSYRLFCDWYTDGFSYGTVKLTVTADGKPVPVAAPASTPAPAFKPGAKPNTPGVASTSTSKTTGAAAAPGQKVVKVLKGFKANELVTVVLHSDPVALGTFKADANGVVTVEFTVPAGTPLGQHTIAYDGDAGTHFEEALVLTKDGKALAYTGASIAMPLIGGSVLLAAGAGAMVIGRRRRTTGATQA